MYKATLGIQHSEYLILEEKDIHGADKYRFNQLKNFIYRAYHQCKLPKPKVFLACTDELQLESNLGLNYIVVHLGAIEHESMAALKSGICHEIGHCFATQIIDKYNLFHIDYWFKTPIIRKIIKPLGKGICQKSLMYAFILFFTLSIILTILCAFFFTNKNLTNFSLLISILNIPVLLLLICSLLISNKLLSEYPGRLYFYHMHYRWLCEEVADEFALYMTHNLTSSIRSLLAQYDYSQYCILHNPHLKTKRQKIMRKVEKYRDDIIFPGSVHPSVKERLSRLIRFQQSNYQAW